MHSWRLQRTVNPPHRKHRGFDSLPIDYGPLDKWLCYETFNLVVLGSIPAGSILSYIFFLCFEDNIIV